MNAPAQKNSGLAITSLILGVLVCCGPFAGIPAIVTGILARRKIAASNGELKGSGMAVAGIVLGSIVTALSIILAAIILPGLPNGISKGKQAYALARQQILLTAMEKGDTWPADAGITSAGALVDSLIKNGAMTQDEVKICKVDDFLVGNVSASDPGATILLRTKPGLFDSDAVVVTFKDGNAQIFESEGEVTGEPPAREPQYLSE